MNENSTNPGEVCSIPKQIKIQYIEMGGNKMRRKQIFDLKNEYAMQPQMIENGDWEEKELAVSYHTFPFCHTRDLFYRL